MRNLPSSLPSLLLLSVLLFITACDDEKPSSEVISIGGMMMNESSMTQGLLRLDHPTNGQLFNTREIRVQGIHPNASEVLVNGTSVPVVSQRFNTMIALEDGAHVLVVSSGEDVISVNIVIDSTPPQVQITEPEYGTHLDSNDSSLVTIIGVATDGDNGSGIQSVLVNGQGVLVEPNGRFQYTYEPEFGLNRPLAIAVDQAGNESDCSRGFLFGRFKSWGSQLDRGLRIEIKPPAFDVIAVTLENALKSGLVEDLINENMGFSDEIAINDILFQDIDVQLIPQNGYLEISISFYDLRVFFELSSPETTGDVYISPATLSARLVLTPLPDGTLDAEVLNPELNLENLNVQVDNALLDTAITFVEGYVSDLAEDTLLAVIDQALIGELLSPNLFSPEFDILGVPVRVRALFQSVNMTAESAQGELGIKIEDLPVINPSIGYLHQITEGAPARLMSMASADIHQNTLHYIFSHLWYGGLLNTTLAEITEPPSALSAALLNGFTDGKLLEYMSPAEMIGVRLRPMLPPTSRFDLTRPSVILVDIVDLLLDLTLPDGRAWFTMGLDITAAITPRLINNRLGLDVSLTVRGVKVDEPLFPVQSKELITLVANFVQNLPQQLGEEGLRNLFDLNELDFYGLRLSSGIIQSVNVPAPYLQGGINLEAMIQ